MVTEALVGNESKLQPSDICTVAMPILPDDENNTPADSVKNLLGSRQVVTVATADPPASTNQHE